MLKRLVLVVLTLLVCARTTSADVRWSTLEPAEGPPLEYALVLPDDFDADRTYPCLLALPPGGQDRRMVEASLGRYWGKHAALRGWIVVSPAAPAGTSFFSGGERAIPALLDHVTASFKVEGGRFHLAGSSNGGRSAFRVVGLHPERFVSVTVLPGYPPEEADVARLGGLKGMPVSMFVGGKDTRWVERMREARARMEALGVDVQLTELEGEGHVPPSLDGPVIMEHLENMRARVAVDQGVVARVGAVLDALHHAASIANGHLYFGLFTPDAVFIGTDATERWTLPEFRAYAMARFRQGRGWTYRATSRHVAIGPDGRTAWFDELLHNEKYGRCRGTGVLVRREGDGAWRIAQYHLTIPIPNEHALEVVRMIGEDGTEGPGD